MVAMCERRVVTRYKSAVYNHWRYINHNFIIICSQYTRACAISTTTSDVSISGTTAYCNINHTIFIVISTAGHHSTYSKARITRSDGRKLHSRLFTTGARDCCFAYPGCPANYNDVHTLCPHCITIRVYYYDD